MSDAHPWHQSIMASERAAIQIAEAINDRGHDALSHVDYQRIIHHEIAHKRDEPCECESQQRKEQSQ